MSVKLPSVCRNPVFPEMVIPDLKEMEGTGRYNRDALLWQQDGYVSRALIEHQARLRELHAQLVESGASPDEIRRQKTRTLIECACATYASEKAAGRGADRKSSIEATRSFFESEAMRHGGYLRDLAEHVKMALENAMIPDIESHSRHAWISMAKIALSMRGLEASMGSAAALPVANLLRDGIGQNLRSDKIGDQPAKFWARLMKAAGQIGENPNTYIKSREPSRIEMPERGPWDYAPMRRQNDP